MKNLAQILHYNWHPARIIFLVIACLLLAQAWQSKDMPFGLIGGLFLYQGIFNTGCCGMSGAFRSNKKASSQKSLEERIILR
jgi:hypothetical protein